MSPRSLQRILVILNSYLTQSILSCIPALQPYLRLLHTVVRIFKGSLLKKIDNLRAHILLPSQDPSEPLICSSVLTHFKPVLLFPLTDIIMHTKPTTCYLDVLPTPSLSCHFCLRFWRKSSSTNCPHFSGFWINVSLVSELSTAHSLLY